MRITIENHYYVDIIYILLYFLFIFWKQLYFIFSVKFLLSFFIFISPAHHSSLHHHRNFSEQHFGHPEEGRLIEMLLIKLHRT